MLLTPAPDPRVPIGRQGRFLLSEPEWQAIAGRLNLSPRELQIVRCVFDDRKEKAIAAELAISSHTVHTHLVRLYRKLRVASRIELIVRVMAEDVVQSSRTARSA
jgi:DNA-binding NarL/FixJ family response regulator